MSPVGVSWWTILLIGDVSTVFVPVADHLLLNAVSAVALELVRPAFVVGAVLLVGAVIAVRVMIATPFARNASLVLTLELGL